MRSIATLLLALAVAAPLAAQDLQTIAPLVPKDSDFLLALQWSSGGLSRLVGMISLVPEAATKVFQEQCATFQGDTGVNPLEITLLAITGQAQSKSPPLVIARTKADAKKLAAALKQAGPFAQAKFEEDAQGLTVTRPDLVLRYQEPGVILVGTPKAMDAVTKPADGAAKAPGSDLVGELIKHGGDKSTLCLEVKIPAGITASMPAPLAAQFPPALMARLRGVYAGARGDNYVLDIGFDTADAASAAQPVVAGALKTAEGTIEQATTTVIAQTRSVGPFWSLHPQVLGMRSWLETYKTLEGALRLSPSGTDLGVALPKSTIGEGLSSALLIGIVAAVAVPNFASARTRANERACFANQKILAGALEMYKLDKNKSPGPINAALLAELVKEGYMQQIPEDPGQGDGTADHYYSVDTGNGVACKVHGNIDGSIKPQGAAPEQPGR